MNAARRERGGRGSIDETVIGEGTSVRPGSWTGAKAQDGSPENLRGPTHVHARASRQIGPPAEQWSWPDRSLDPPGSAGNSEHEAERDRVGPGSETNK